MVYVVYLGGNGLKQADSLQGSHLNIVPYLHVSRPLQIHIWMQLWMKVRV